MFPLLPLLDIAGTFNRKRSVADIAPPTPTPPPPAYGATAPSGPGPPHIEASQSHPDTPHSVGLLWASDQTVAETTTQQHTTLTRDWHP